MLELYHVTASRSCRVRWLLEELGIPYEIRSLGFGDGSLKSAEYRAVHPLGKVPALVDEATVIYESGAIVEYLLERYGEGRLAPAVGSPDRAAFLQWVHFSEASVMVPMAEIMAHRFMLPEEQRSEHALQNARLRLRRTFQVIEDALAEAEYLVGREFSAADVMVVYGVELANKVGELPDDLPNVAAYRERLSKRPAFATAFG